MYVLQPPFKRLASLIRIGDKLCDLSHAVRIFPEEESSPGVWEKETSRLARAETRH